LISYIAIPIIIIILLYCYKSDYKKGLMASIFCLVLLPKSLAIYLTPEIPSFTVHRIIIVLMLIMWMKSRNSSSLRVGQINFIYILIAISFFSGISALISSNFLISFKRYLYFIFESLIFYIILASSIEDESDFLKLFKVIIASLCVVAFLGIIERYTGFNFTDYLGYKGTYDDLSTLATLQRGTHVSYEHRILLGVAMAIGLFYSLSMIGRVKGKKVFIYWIVSFLLGAMLYFAQSRGPWLAFILSAGLAVAFFNKPLVKRFAILACIVIAVFIIRPGVFSTIEGLYDSTLNPESIKGSSYAWRYQVIQVVTDKIGKSDSLANYFFGFGQGSFAFEKFPLVTLTTGFTVKIESFDCEYAVILLERGYVGLLLVIFLYIVVIKKGVTNYFKYKSMQDISLMSLACVIIIAFMKINVDIYAPQLVYIELLNIAVISRMADIPIESSVSSL